MIIDVHHHLSDGRHYPGYEDFPARLVAAMDRRGWTATCLSGVGPRYHNLGNAEVAAAMARFPSRIIGLGHLDPDRPDAVAEVDALHRLGMRGLKIIGTRRRYDDDAYLPAYARAQALGLPILFHTGFLGGTAAADGPEDISSDRYRPITLDRVARLFPRLTIIAAHLGGSMWLAEAIAVMGHGNVYADASGGAADLPASYYRQPQFAGLDWDKVLFGSDSLPDDGHIPYDRLSRLASDLGLPPATVTGIFGGTAARLFGVI